MSFLKALFGKNAPTHHAEKYWPAHDGTLNIVEARRGRGKSFGAVRIMLEWLKQRWADIVSGAAPHAKIYSNIRFRIRNVAYMLCRMNICNNLEQAEKILQERIVYTLHWDDLLTAYDSLILHDEANRDLDIYDGRKEQQVLMKTVHDWLQQTRKHVLTLYFFLQDVTWIKSQVLSLTDRLWRAKRVRKKGTQHIRYFPWYGADPFAKGKDGQLNRSADFKMRFDFDIWVARCYDTKQAVQTMPPETKFHSFGEISDYMLAHGLKPVPVNERPDFLTWEQEREWFTSATERDEYQKRTANLGWASHTSPGAVPAPSGGGAAPGARSASKVPPPLDLSHLPTSYPGRRADAV